MLKYFIRTDNLRGVIPIQKSFMDAPKVPISPSTLAELGGYLLDKRLSQTEGVSDAEIDKIEGIKDVLIRATELDEKQRVAIYKKTKRVPPPLPEPHYQLGRYYNFYNSPLDERQALKTAADAFDAALIETPKRTRYRIDNQRLLANSMIRQLEWIDAEETLAKGVSIYENALERSLIKRRYADAGKLYEALGNIEYFIKNGDMNNAIRFYRAAERNEWSPPEMRYRTGAAYYQLGDYPAALERFFDVSMAIPYNRRLLHALGNVSYLRNDFFAAQGYYNRLIGILENDRRRIPALTPDERIDHADLLRRMMEAFNNMGVTLNALAARTGNPVFRAEALARLSESARYWENTSRNENFVRPGLEDPGLPGKGLPYLNMRQILYPLPGGGNLLLYNNIDKDVLEPSEWEELASKTTWREE
jgi:tetratricopeptide (TPR) repeat protein